MQIRDARRHRQLRLGEAERQLAEVLDAEGLRQLAVVERQPDLLVGLAARDVEGRLGQGVGLAAGEGRVAGVVAQRGGAHGYDDAQVAAAVGEEEEQDGGAAGDWEGVPDWERRGGVGAEPCEGDLGGGQRVLKRGLRGGRMMRELTVEAGERGAMAVESKTLVP